MTKEIKAPKVGHASATVHREEFLDLRTIKLLTPGTYLARVFIHLPRKNHPDELEAFYVRLGSFRTKELAETACNQFCGKILKYVYDKDEYATVKLTGMKTKGMALRKIEWKKEAVRKAAHEKRRQAILAQRAKVSQQ